MIEITPVMIDEIRFLGIVMYLPKCTVRMMFNMKLMLLDSCFDLNVIKKKCPVPMIQCSSGTFEIMIAQKVRSCCERATEFGVKSGMDVKEAIRCVFSQKETSEEFY